MEEPKKPETEFILFRITRPNDEENADSGNDWTARTSRPPKLGGYTHPIDGYTTPAKLANGVVNVLGGEDFLPLRDPLIAAIKNIGHVLTAELDNPTLLVRIDPRDEVQLLMNVHLYAVDPEDDTPADLAATVAHSLGVREENVDLRAAIIEASKKAEQLIHGKLTIASIDKLKPVNTLLINLTRSTVSCRHVAY
ncbi:MAG: hypothetical protein HOJ15_04625 [Candidatus Jacksonbacteria bacterium]|jgi:hypothetical protein|nr:hypothetical protein [Candidatus Jacksonbacteria bacterium]MBT6301682.1 hypothetical protein [Candidatus Jacksonbacteria bacterium]MBT6757168.1 hypothetical protein [Candidatus Jacksonbacteria bacterium]MBT6955365.1 hypothetical protein [Candidatus Jacksonbacteria bacterium]MBT7008706.1 hypothetical protein [Candidatus Jacksonbacteria bacterium]